MPSAALDVNRHRAVLVGEGSIAMDAVHVYELPIPTSYYESGGSRYIDVALAFDPPTRSQRLDYLGNKLEFYVVRDIEITELIELFSKFADEEPLDDDPSDDPTDPADQSDPDSEDPDSDDAMKPAGLRGALGSRLIDFDTSVTERSRSANQLGRKRFTQRWKPPAAGGTYLVVRSLNRWCDQTLVQPYAVAVSLRRDPDQPAIYLELAAQLEAVAEIELEVETELES